MLKWSPSWGEICYFAYGLTTIEFHDDLYSSIEDALKKTPTDKLPQKDFENHILTKRPNIQKIKWPDPLTGPQEETLMTFVRNSIHHPDNKNRPIHTHQQLRESIEIMIDLIKNP